MYLLSTVDSKTFRNVLPNNEQHFSTVKNFKYDIETVSPGRMVICIFI